MKVLGKNVIVFIYDGGVWKPYACALQGTLNVTTEYLETSQSGQGYFATYRPSKNGYTGTLEGVTSLLEPGMLTLPDLRQKQLAHESMLMRFQREDLAGNLYTDEGLFWITSSSDVGSFDGMNLFTIDLLGSGTLTQVFTAIIPYPPSGIFANRYEYTGTGGESSFTAAELIGKTILEANKDGLGYSKIIFSGTPVAKEMKFDYATGTCTWPAPFEPGEESYIIFQ